MLTNFCGEFKATHVQTLREALIMRRIRNACREFMTHNNGHIGLLRQIVWFYTAYARGRSLAFQAFVWRMNGRPVGYGIVRVANDKWWVTGGLIESARGKGFGRKIFETVTRVCHIVGEDAWLDVFRDNRPAVELYYSLGYKLAQSYDRPEDGKRILVMRRNKND